MPNRPDPFHDLPPARRRPLARWVAAWAVMVVLTLVIGGITRLTESGLSITEWAPVSGLLPPLSNAAWREAFQAYQQIPEYQEINLGMTLAQFKSIYFWEYVHRVWARLIGLMLAGPLVFLWLKGWLVPSLTRRLVILVALTGAQGALGWYMVASGLVERTDVSQYRLAAHLGLALVIYVAAIWTAADLWTVPGEPPGSTRRARAEVMMLAGLVFLTALAGAFVAGIDGGKAYNTFPLMGGRLVPSGYLILSPWWRNIFENVAAVQFNHRWLGVVTFAAVLAGRFRWRHAALTASAQRRLFVLPWIAGGQVLLGVATLLLVVPVLVAALHQLAAVALLTVAILLLHAIGPPGRGDSAP